MNFSYSLQVSLHSSLSPFNSAMFVSHCLLLRSMAMDSKRNKHKRIIQNKAWIALFIQLEEKHR